MLFQASESDDTAETEPCQWETSKMKHTMFVYNTCTFLVFYLCFTCISIISSFSNALSFSVLTQIWAQLKLRSEECMSSLAPTEYDKGLQDDDDDDHNESEIEVEN